MKIGIGLGNGRGQKLPTAVADLSQVDLWLDAAQIVAADDSTVANWSDQSGNGRDAIHASLGPTYKADAGDGFPGVRFDGTEILEVGSFPAFNSRSFTMFCVLTYNLASISAATILNGPGFKPRWSIFAAQRLYFDGVGQSEGIATAVTTARDMVAVRSGSDGIDFWVGQAFDGSESALTNNDGSIGTLTLGSDGGGSDVNFQGDFHELLVSLVPLTDAEVIGMLEYLGQKWSV